jgi:hypothetical protein
VGDVGGDRLDPRERALADLVEDLGDPLVTPSVELGRIGDGPRVREQRVDVLDAVLEGVVFHRLLQRSALDGVRRDSAHRVM